MIVISRISGLGIGPDLEKIFGLGLGLGLVAR